MQQEVVYLEVPGSDKMQQEVVYHEVPRSDKDQAKGRGARWDPLNAKWHAPPGMPMSEIRERFSVWLSASPTIGNLGSFLPAASYSAAPSYSSLTDFASSWQYRSERIEQSCPSFSNRRLEMFGLQLCLWTRSHLCIVSLITINR